jgi:hypothetical protein
LSEGFFERIAGGEVVINNRERAISLLILKMDRAADRPRELSGPTYLTRQNYSRITVVGPAALSYPVAAAVPALVQEQALVLAQGPVDAPQVLAQAQELV